MRQKRKYKIAKKKVSFKRCILVVMEKANLNSMLLSYKFIFIMFYFFTTVEYLQQFLTNC